MIVVIGIPSEPPVEMVLHAAHEQNIETCILNQRHAAHEAIEISSDGIKIRALFHGTGGIINLEDTTGIYIRMADHSNLPEYKKFRSQDMPAQQRMEAWHMIVSDWVETAPCPVMNRLKPSNSNMSKPYQAQLIEKCGLRTPRTLITNEPSEVIQFKESCGRIIYKSISAHRSIVKELIASDIGKLDRIRALPAQFQELLEGDDIRVHVVGDQIFATRITSDVVDYRYAERQGGSSVYEDFELPASIRRKCFETSRRLDLPLCGIDLKRVTKNDYICFEVNPSPAFSAFGEQASPIASAIVQYLSTSAKSRS